MKPVNSTVSSIKESIFSQMTLLAQKNEAINLSQGFPDFEGPAFIREALKEAADKKSMGQYAPMRGIPYLLETLSQHYKESYGIEANEHQLTVTNGATEGIMVTALALLEPGDEVILFEPYYDSYPIAAKLAGATIKTVRLNDQDFSWDSKELEAAFSERTKLVFFNNPNNPTGRVFTKDELNELASLVIKYDAYLLSDEVYEFLTYDEHKHIPIATIEGMEDRTITTGSAGKTFGHTGLKVGWLHACAELTHAIRMVHQFNVYSVNPMAQYAVARGLELKKTYIPDFRKLYNHKRLLLKEVLENARLKAYETQGTYFTLVKLPHWAQEKGMNDVAFCQYLIEKAKVATIPPSAFYEDNHPHCSFVRFCFSKTDETLEKAGLNLKKLIQAP